MRTYLHATHEECYGTDGGQDGRDVGDHRHGETHGRSPVWENE